MSVTETPGICAQHVIISQDCIKTHGAHGAFREGIMRVEKEYLNLFDAWAKNPDVKYHIVLTIERPEVKIIGTMNNDSDYTEKKTKIYDDPDEQNRRDNLRSGNF